MSTSATQASPTTMRAVTQREFSINVLRVDESRFTGARRWWCAAGRGCRIDRGTWHSDRRTRIARVAIGWRPPWCPFWTSPARWWRSART
jgi:hypothetical protein